jgi:hypothetical protein
MEEQGEELAQYYVLTREQFEELDPEGESAVGVLQRMEPEDSVIIAAVSEEEDGTAVYLPVVVLRDEGATAFINLNWLDEAQTEAIKHCLERLETFTLAAYETLEEEMPREFAEQRARLTAALEEEWWQPQQFAELDDSLYQLRRIVTDMESDSEFAEGVTGFDELFAAIDVAETNFHAIRAVLYSDEEE